MATTTSTDSDSVLLNQIVNQGVNIYGSREKIRSALIQYAKKYLNLQDADIRKTSYLAYLIDQISILSANHIFYDSTIYKEFFFTDAQLSESVNNLAKWIGYTIPKSTPAQVKVLFNIPLNFSGNHVTFNLSPYFYVRTSDGIPFIIKSNSLDAEASASGTVNIVDIQQNATSGTIIGNNSMSIRDSDGVYQPVYLASDKKSVFFSLAFEQKEIVLNTYQVPNDLSVNQFYNINVEFNGQVSDLDVYVISPSYNQTLDTSTSSIDGALDAATFDPNEEMYDSSGVLCTWTKWEEAVNGIYTMSSRANQYCWIGGYNKGMLMFGNGVLGRQPPAGSIIAVKLHVTRGSTGNIVAKTISSGDPIYFDSNPSNTIKYTVYNPNSAYGGDDLLTIPEIKQKAIVNLAAKNRLVSDQDYDDIKTILGNDLPINDCCPILKRSDIKVNEIMTFTTLNYISDNINQIVPTRNARMCLENVNFDDEGKFTLMRNTLVNKKNSNVGDDEYLTLFNLTLNKKNRTVNYDYILQNVDGSAVRMYSRLKDNYYEQFTYMTPNGSSFGINTNKTAILNNDFPLDVTLNVNHSAKYNTSDIDEDSLSSINFFDFNVDRFQCKMVTKWGNNDTYDCTAAYGYRYETVTTQDDDGNDIVTYKSFGWTIDNYLNVPEGIQRFEFQLQCYAPFRNANGDILATDGSIAITASELNMTKSAAIDSIKEAGRENKILKMSWYTIRTFYTDIVIRRDLSNFMSSSISFDYPYTKEEVTDKIVNKTLAKDVYVEGSETEILFPKGTILTYENYQTLVLNHTEIVFLYTGIENCYIHNVPVVLKSYYDSVILSENEETNATVKSNFEITVMQELVQNMYFNDRKMLTDFINIKFSDTYGPMYNLRYNPEEYEVESRYNNTPWWDPTTQTKPETIVNEDYVKPEANESNVYYIVNNHLDKDHIIGENNKDLQLSDYIGYIALRIVNENDDGTYTYDYQLIEPTRGMFIKVKDELDADGYINTLVWTGRIWKSVSEYNIPLEIKLKIEVDSTVVSKTDETITKEIIDALTKYFKDKIGIQKNIDRSEVIKVCRSISGVVYAELISPEFDIRFEYEIQDLTQRQLIDYTPQYIGFRGKDDTESDYSRSSINVEIVRI